MTNWRHSRLHRFPALQYHHEWHEVLLSPIVARLSKLEECRLLGGCKTGEAKITKGYRLKTKHVIHTVGPVWHGGKSNEPEQLASCYRRSLEIAVANDLSSIAFPCISTGAYGYPPEAAAEIGINTVREFIETGASLKEVIFCCFSEQDFQLYQRVLSEPAV